MVERYHHLPRQLVVVVGVRVKDNAKWWKKSRHTCSGKGRRFGLSRAAWTFLGKVRTRHMRHTSWVDVLKSVLFIYQKPIEAVGKSKDTTKEQRTTQAGCTTTSTERRARRNAQFTKASKPTASIYFSVFRRIRLTHSAIVCKAYAKNVPWEPQRSNDAYSGKKT